MSENFIKRFGFCQFFFSFFGCFLVKKRPKKAEIQKSFFVAFFLLGSIYIPNFRKFHLTVWILPIFFLIFLAVFWLKNGQKGWNPKKVFFVAFLLLGSIYIPDFRKFHQTVWILASFFFFLFWLKNGQKKPKSKKKIVAFFFMGSIYIPNFRKIHPSIWILPIFFIFVNFGPF